MVRDSLSLPRAPLERAGCFGLRAKRLQIWRRSLRNRKNVLGQTVHINPSRTPRARGLALAIAASGSLLIVQFPRLSAQSEDGPYRMLLTPERALAFVQAADRKLDYVPGEVLVKFKTG